MDRQTTMMYVCMLMSQRVIVCTLETQKNRKTENRKIGGYIDKQTTMM